MRALVALFVASLAATAAAGQSIKPGKWEMTSTVLSLDMAEASPAVQQTLVGKTKVRQQCVTARDVADGPKALFKATNGQCRYDRFAVAGGTIDAVMVCGSGPGAMRSTIKGTIAADRFAAAQSMTNAMMKMTSKSSGRWIGPCA